MASTYSDLKIELIGTGDQTGTWGTTTNNNFSIAISEAITGSADVAFSSADVTVTLTNSNAAQTARNLRLNLTGTSGGARQLILGSGCQIEKLYLINNGLADAVTVKNTSGTGIAVPAGKSIFVYNDGTNVVQAVSNADILGPSSATDNAITRFDGTTGKLVQNSLVTIADDGAFTAPQVGSVIPFYYANQAAFPSASTYHGALAHSHADGAMYFAHGGVWTKLADVTSASTFTGLQTFAGTSSNADLKTSNMLETATISATAATGTINYDVTTQSVLYFTSNASGNFTVNFRGSSGTSLNTIMTTGESLSVTFLVTNGSTAYYNSAVQVDGSSVTPKYQGGTAPTSGNASSIDSYTYVLIKTGSAVFTVLATQTKFA